MGWSIRLDLIDSQKAADSLISSNNHLSICVLVCRIDAGFEAQRMTIPFQIVDLMGAMNDFNGRINERKLETTRNHF